MSLSEVADIQIEHDRALGLVEALATENRRLQQQLRSHINDSRRLRDAVDQMRTELIVMNRTLEPLHVQLEQNRRISRDHDDLVERLHAELREVRARLDIVYASRSWKLTKPWRLAGRILKRLGG